MGLNILIGYYIFTMILSFGWLAFSERDYIRTSRGGVVFSMVLQAIILFILFGLK